VVKGGEDREQFAVPNHVPGLPGLLIAGGRFIVHEIPANSAARQAIMHAIKLAIKLAMKLAVNKLPKNN